MNIVPLKGPLALTNSGELEVVFLGTGTAFASELNQTNFLIIKGDTHILVDLGMTGPKALAEVGLKAEDITTILPTHSHADHIGGIEYLALRNRYVAIPSGRPKITMISTDEYHTILWNESLRGGLEYNEITSEGKRLTLEDYFNLQLATPVPGTLNRPLYRIKYGEITLELFHTNHIPGAAEFTRDAFITYGLMIDDRVFVSGDTKFDTDLIEHYGPKAEFIFHDASLMPNAVHASINDLKTLPKSIREKMMLMHYQDETRDEHASDFSGLAKQQVRYIFP